MTITPARIPASAAEITVEWLNDRLGDEFGPIASFEAQAIGEGVGILGEITRLTLDYADGATGPASVIAKCQSAFEENIGLAQAMGFYVREVSFYQQVAGDLAVRVPHCHHADMAEGGAPFVLIMEDITDARMIDQIVGATREETLRIAETVADLQAPFWDNDALDALEWLPPMNNPMYRAADQLVIALWDSFVENWGDRLPADVVAACGELTGIYGDSLDWWETASPRTFTHTDCRAENYLFGSDDTVVMLDFQLSTAHVGTWDIANFLGMSVETENRRLWEADVVRHYHEQLCARGVKDYSFEQCWRDYRYCLMHQAWALIATSNLDPGNERGRILLDKFITRGFAAAAENNSAEYIEAVSGG